MIHGLLERLDVLKVLLRKYGLMGLARLIWSDVLFDYRHGVDTYAPVSKEALFEAGPRREAQNRYVPSTFAIVDAGLAEARKIMGAERYATSHFIDYGSGKGKVLIAAARAGFAKVRGIEYVVELNEIAVANIAKLGLSDRVTPLVGDATTFAPGPQDRILYFFNPFEGEILDATLKTIKSVMPDGPRVVIVFNPVADDIYCRYFEKVAELTAQPGNARYNIYRD